MPSLIPWRHSDFAATRTPGDSASDVVSVLSGPASAISAFGSSAHAPQQSRLSPVSEAHCTDESRDPQSPSENDEGIDAHFEMVNPPPPPPPPDHQTVPIIVKPEARKRGLSISQPILDEPATDIVFSRTAVPSLLSKVSALSTMLASTGGSANPFNELYGAISGRGESASVDVKVFFPHAQEPKGKVMTLNVRRDATVEEVIGFALWNYWEEGWLPNLSEGVSQSDPKLSGVGWIMRIAEDDGEVDEDFPREFTACVWPDGLVHQLPASS